MKNAIKEERIHRYETKIPLQRLQYQELRAAMHDIGLHTKQPFPDRIVHSIYIDTPEYSDYHDNVAGINQRSKTRLRWYDFDTRRLTLEIKRKRSKISDKQCLRINNSTGRVPRRKHDLHALLANLNITDGDALIVSHFRSPTLEVEYRRSYFEIGSDIRMTVDRDMRFRKLYPVASLHWTRSPVEAVVEFKYAVGQERAFSELVRNLPFRVFRHSKYVIGTDSTCVG